MSHRTAEMNPDEVYPRNPGRRRMVNEVQDLQMGEVVELATPSWSPEMLLAVKDGMDGRSNTGHVRLVNDRGTEYGLSVEEYKDTYVARLRSRNGDSYGFVTRLAVVGELDTTNVDWEEIW